MKVFSALLMVVGIGMLIFECMRPQRDLPLLSSELTVYKSRCTKLELENARLNALVPLEEEKSYDQGGEK